MSRIRGLQIGKLTKDRRKLHNEELRNVYCSPNIARANKSRMKWTTHVACM
jgi:hypothetical protein